MVRILWGVFVGSLGAVIWLLASADPGAPRGMATPAPLRDAPAAERPARDGPRVARPLERAAAPLPSVVSAGDPEGSSPGPRAEPEAIAEPQEFLERLIEMARAGDLEALGARVGPGAARASGGLLDAILKKKIAQEDGSSEDGEGSSEVDEMLDQLEIELEPLADGTVRVHASGPGGSAPEPLYVVPKDGSWELVAEGDLPGPRFEAGRAENRLKLLALCQHAFAAEELGGRPGYAATVTELARGLDRTTAYAGALDPELVGAVDGMRPLGSHVFGTLRAGVDGFGYWAAPAAGSGSGETLIVDAAGQVWTRDLGGEPPPAEWPGPDPGAQGWRRAGAR